jgi:hypothetical protein
MKQLVLFALIFLALVNPSSVQAQSYLAGPVPRDPWKTLGQKTGWIMLGQYKLGDNATINQTWFEIVKSNTGQPSHFLPVKGDRIRLLTRCDFFIVGYWKNGRPNQGNPLVSPAVLESFGNAGTHSMLGPGAEIMVEEIAISKGEVDLQLPGVLWARVSPIK